ncbi:OmpA family protein [Phenylobacterium sp.]|jgi:outer membrane protein OmpA-like peptidoglycan-associated protein|uniref:OmpA family protein n=1 Tax=Phenylobacterium sp. TaxID=1871053 RepID=UPI0035AFF49B
MIGTKTRGVVLSALAIGTLGLGGCATKKYVNEQVGVVDAKVAQHETRLGELDQTSREALERATAAGKLAEGKFLYQVVLSDDALKFPTGKATLSSEAEERLTALADRLKGENKNVYVEVQGHTDATGSPEGNIRLGADRAEAVRRYLNKQGVALNRMATISYGEDEPVAPNNTRDGRAANRRVVVVVLS